MKYVLKIKFIFWLFLVLNQSTFGLNNYSIENGLSNNNVDCIIQDSHGFLWIGTWNGLNKYDGYSFEKYYSNKTINGLSDNWITTLFEDSFGTIWTGCSTGLSYYNNKTNSFKTHLDVKNPSISSITEDLQHRIWVSTSAGIFVLDGKTKKLIKTLSNVQNQLFFDLEEMIVDTKGFIWIGCRNGLMIINPTTFKVQKLIKLDWIKTIKFDSKGNIWCGSRTEGLFVVDTANFTKRIYTHNSNIASSIGSNSIWNIYIDKKQNIWIVCQNGFLNKYNPQTDSFIKNHDSKINSNTNEYKSITSVFQDFQGNLWLGFHRAGLYSIRKQSSAFEVYQSAIYNGKKIQFTNVTSFAIGAGNSILFSTDGDGIFILNPIEKIINQLPTNSMLASRNIITLYKSNNTIWAATWGGGIAAINTQKNYAITNYIHAKQNPQSISINNVKGLYMHDSLLWVGTHGDGIALFNTKKQLFYNYNTPHTNYMFNYKEPLWVNQIIVTKNGTIWISTFFGVYTYSQGKLIHYFHDANNSKSLSDNKVYSVFEDSRNQIWLITGNGINMFNNKNKTFENVSNTFKLPIFPRSMAEDAHGKLWISSDEGVVVFSPNTKQIITYNHESLGIDGDFMYNASFKANNGCIYFGTTTGFIKCNPNYVKQSIGKVELVCRHLYINYNKVENSFFYSEMHISNVNTIELPYSKDVITIELAAVCLLQLNQIRYSYKLEGYNDTWIQLDKNRFITFSGLDPGTYSLRMKAVIDNESVQEKTLTIIIHPKWWMTIWFKLIMILLVLLLLYFINNVRLNKQKKLNILLKQKIYESTKDLEKANSELQQQYAIISTKNEELQVANDSKIKLFSIISHDLKNPLNAMLGISQMLIENFSNYSDEKKLQLVNSISTATKSITNLTLNLLNWSIIQTNTIKPSVGVYDISSIIHETVVLEIEIAKAKEIQVITNYNHSCSVLIDRIMIATVIRNIIQNAIKFTPNKGTVTIETFQNTNYIGVKISDSGVGMQQTLIESIHKSNSTFWSYGTNNEKGSGLGLNIAKEFIHKNNGLFTIESIINTGSTFTISLPIGSSLEQTSTQSVCMYTDFEASNQPILKIAKDYDTIVCIIEDNENVLALIENVFSAMYKTLTATNGKAGLDLILTHVPDIIITDIEMPKMSGIELIKELRKHPITNHIPIVILSSKDTDYNQIKGYHAGADDYVTKPFNKEILQNKVFAILEQRKRYLQHAKVRFNSIQNQELPQSYDDIFLKKAIEHIELHYKDEQFSVEDIAKYMSISRVQLYRKFKTIAGINPQDFIKNYRLEKAVVLLKTKKYRIADVAFAVGFNEPHYFSSCFLKHYGVTPSKFIEMQK